MHDALAVPVVIACLWLATGDARVSAQPARQTAPAAAREAVSCRSIGIAPERTWTFEPVAGTWRVTHTVAGVARRVSLDLPNATATLGDSTISLRARTANGGIDVTLSGPWDRATLDAYVNYELEVNVDASLTPEIDEISTDMPLGVSCRRLPVATPAADAIPRR